MAVRFPERTAEAISGPLLDDHTFTATTSTRVIGQRRELGREVSFLTASFRIAFPNNDPLEYVYSWWAHNHEVNEIES